MLYSVSHTPSKQFLMPTKNCFLIAFFNQVAVEATLEHPFYVVGQGWSSAIPERTLIKFQLPCNKLKAGDVCISLSHCSSNQRPKDNLEGQDQQLKMMRPPPVPTLQQERRRSNSASPSDKLLLKRAFAASATASSTSPLASKRFTSPTKQVAFEEPLIKRPKSDQK